MLDAKARKRRTSLFGRRKISRATDQSPAPVSTITCCASPMPEILVHCSAPHHEVVASTLDASAVAGDRIRATRRMSVKRHGGGKVAALEYKAFSTASPRSDTSATERDLELTAASASVAALRRRLHSFARFLPIIFRMKCCEYQEVMLLSASLFPLVRTSLPPESTLQKQDASLASLEMPPLLEKASTTGASPQPLQSQATPPTGDVLSGAPSIEVAPSERLDPCGCQLPIDAKLPVERSGQNPPDSLLHQSSRSVLWMKGEVSFVTCLAELETELEAGKTTCCITSKASATAWSSSMPQPSFWVRLRISSSAHLCRGNEPWLGLALDSNFRRFSQT
eukprot:scaffold1881_cov256-Pinguiococcus_pyrenoidosus.AAC.17